MVKLIIKDGSIFIFKLTPKNIRKNNIISIFLKFKPVFPMQASLDNLGYPIILNFLLLINSHVASVGVS